MALHYHRGEERARTLAEELGGASVFPADLTAEDEVDRLFDAARAALGAIDVCAAVAGVWPTQDLPVWELPLERWDIRANLTATFLTARAFLREVARTGTARRPRRLDRRPRRRGGPRGLRGREVRRPRRPPPLAQERDRARGAAREGERGSPGWTESR